ncbi:MAG: hypothetical protein ACM3U2_24345 [Deltaproteobacteria bacterium]
MKRETVIWTVLFVAGGLFLAYRASTGHGMGKSYVKQQRINPQSVTDLRMKFVDARPGEEGAMLSLPRTAGLWVSAFFTLAVLSFLYRDNVFYKIAESIYVGVAAGWAMVSAGFWEAIVPKLLANLAPGLMRAWALPELDKSKEPSLVYLVPLVLGIMLLWRLAPRGAWIARWPLAFIVGTFAGIKLIGSFDADFVSQIRSTIIPLVVITHGGQVDVWSSLRNLGVVFGVLSCLTYFFFSLEHRGFGGRIARVGVWYLMITFGASFAFTVMGRIALLAARIEFLFDDWLWLIDPTNKRPW